MAETQTQVNPATSPTIINVTSKEGVIKSESRYQAGKKRQEQKDQWGKNVQERKTRAGRTVERAINMGKNIGSEMVESLAKLRRADRIADSMQNNGDSVASHALEGLAAMQRGEGNSTAEAQAGEHIIERLVAGREDGLHEKIGEKLVSDRHRDIIRQLSDPSTSSADKERLTKRLERSIRRELKHVAKEYPDNEVAQEFFGKFATQEERREAAAGFAEMLKQLSSQDLGMMHQEFVQREIILGKAFKGSGRLEDQYKLSKSLLDFTLRNSRTAIAVGATAGIIANPLTIVPAAGVLVSAGITYFSQRRKLNYDHAMALIDKGRQVDRPKGEAKGVRGLLKKLWGDVDLTIASEKEFQSRARLLAIKRAGIVSAASVGFGLLAHGGFDYYTSVHTPHQALQTLAGGHEGSGCFVAGTLILMADGTEKAIELVAVGEMVLSYDEETKEIQAQRVLGVQSPVHTHLVELTFSNGKKTRNTPNHRYLTKEKGWASVDPVLTQERDGVEAHKLEINDSVFAYLDGELTEVKIASITEITQETQTFNLSNIENTHTFFANGIVVHNVKLSQNPGTGDMGAPSPTPTSGESSLQQLLDEGKKVLKTIQDGASSGKEHTPLPPGDPGKLLTDFHHFLGDKLDPKNPDSGKIVDSDLSHLQQEVDSLHDPKLSHDFDTFMEHRASGTVTPDDTAQIVKDAEYLQVKPQIDAINTDIAEMRGAQDTETYGRLLSNLQNQVNELPPQYRGTFLADIHKAGLDVAISKTPDLDKLQQDLDILKATTDPNILHAGGAGDITALENANRYGVMVQNDLIEARHGNTLDFGDTNIYGDLAGLAGNRIDDALGHVGQTFDNVVGNTIHDHLPGNGGYAAEQAHAPTQIPTGHHLENLPVSGNQQVNLPAGWHVSGNTILDNHNQSVGTFNIHDGKVTFDPNSYAESTYGIPAGAETFPLEGIGQGSSLAEVGQYNPADWHWDTQISQPGLFSHNELTMSVDNGVVHYGGNLTGTNIPSHLDNIPIANDPNLQNIAAMNGGHIAPSDMVTAVRLNNGQVVLLPMSPDGSAHLPPELYSNGQLQNLNYISTALVTGKDGQILHMGDLQHGLPDGAKIVSLASNPFQTPTTDAINHLNITGGNGAPQIIDLAKVIHTRVGGEGAGGGGGGGLPEVLGSFPGGAAGLAAAGGVIALASIPAARNVYRARTGGGSLSRFQRGIAIVGFPGSLAAVGAAAIHNRRAKKHPPTPAASVVPARLGTPVANTYAGNNIQAAVTPAHVVATANRQQGRRYNGAVNQLAAALPPSPGVTPQQHRQHVASAVNMARIRANGFKPVDEGSANEYIPYDSGANNLVNGVGADLDLVNEVNARAMAEIMMPDAPDGEKAAAADAIRRAAVIRAAINDSANRGDTQAQIDAAIIGMQGIDTSTSFNAQLLAMQARALHRALPGNAGEIIDGYQNQTAINSLSTDVTLAVVGVVVRGGTPTENIDMGLTAAGVDFSNPRSATSAADAAMIAASIYAACERGSELGDRNTTQLAKRRLIIERISNRGASREALGQVLAGLHTNRSRRERDVEAVRLVQQATVGGAHMASSGDLYGIIRGLQAGNVAQDDLRQGFLRAVRREAGRIPLTPAQEAVVAVMLDETHNAVVDKLNIGLQDLAVRSLSPGTAQGERGEQLAGFLEGILDVVIPLGLTSSDLQTRVSSEFPGLGANEQSLIALSVLQALNSSKNPLPPDQQLAFAFAASGIEPRAGGSTPMSAVQAEAIARIGMGIIGGSFATLPGIREAIRTAFKLDNTAAGQVAAEIVNLYSAQGNTDLVAVERGICNLLLPTNFTPETYFAVMNPAGQRLRAVRGAGNPITDVNVEAAMNAIPTQIPSIEMQVVMYGAFLTEAQTPGSVGIGEIITRMITRGGVLGNIDITQPNQKFALVNGLRIFKAQDPDAAVQITEAIGKTNGSYLNSNLRRAEVKATLSQARANGITDEAELASLAVMVAAPRMGAGGANFADKVQEIQAVVEELADRTPSIEIRIVRKAMEQLGFNETERREVVENYIPILLAGQAQIPAGAANRNKLVHAQIDLVNKQIERALAAAGYPPNGGAADTHIQSYVFNFVNGPPGTLNLGISQTDLHFI